MERGKPAPTIETLLLLSERFRKSVDWILRGEGGTAADTLREEEASPSKWPNKEDFLNYFACPELLFLLVGGTVIVIPLWKVFSKAGYPGPWL